MGCYLLFTFWDRIVPMAKFDKSASTQKEQLSCGSARTSSVKMTCLSILNAFSCFGPQVYFAFPVNCVNKHIILL